MAPKLSVVIATWNRRALLERLLGQLARQTLPPGDFEVVVVDDGSREPVKPALDALAKTLPFRLVVEAQANAGAAAARHRGVLLARGALLVITDDDMQVDPDFLALHLAAHQGGRRVVVGRIRPDPHIGEMPVFERWYAHVQEQVAARASSGRLELRGNSLLTGNVSLPREDYLAVGGFDRTLGHAEDSELGLRLEKRGLEFVFLNEAHVFHGSDHVDLAMFLARARKYGVFDSRIAKKHPELPHASPWRYLFRMNPLARPLVGAAFALPALTGPVSSAGLAAIGLADRAGLSRLAFKAVAVVYAMEYFRGVRAEAPSALEALKDLARYVRTRRGRA